MANRTIRTAEKGERLLNKLREGLSISAACKAEGIGRRSYYDWRSDEPDFAAAADDAIEEGTDRLEDEARKRASGITGSDTLLIFLLKARRPDKYRERNETKHVGPDGGAIPIQLIRVHEPAGDS